jgi:membrane-associated phospholipid phosphatase
MLNLRGMDPRHIRAALSSGWPSGRWAAGTMDADARDAGRDAAGQGAWSSWAARLLGARGKTALPAKPASLKLKLFAGIGASLLNALIYHIANHCPLGVPRVLPWTPVDMAVPFIPETLWIYISDYVLVGSAFLLCRTEDDVRRFARAFVMMLFVGCAVHVLWPTVFPRERFPVHEPGLTAAAFALLRTLDLPTSCLPSLHVAGSYLAALSLWRRRGLAFTLWTAWATAVTVSTLTTKQHYALDVLAGLCLAITLGLIFFRQHREIPETAAHPAL